MGKELLAVMAVGVLCSAALAGGPLGPPMSVLDHGQWAIDAGYFYEEMDLHGCYEWQDEGYYYEDYGGEDSYYDYYSAGRGKITLKNFKTNTWMASIEYGLCDNWDVFLRLGMADAKADMVWSGLEGGYDEYEGGYWADLDYEEESVDFGYGFAWQVGTAFTFCQSGPWTFGGRMQIGFAYPDEWSDSWAYYDEYENGDYQEWDQYDEASVDLEWWQAVGYIGANYEVSDALSFYAGGGLQVLHATIDEKWSGYDDYYTENGSYYEWDEEWQGSGSQKIRHASAIGLFGGLWKPTDRTNVSADVLFGEAGKWGIGVMGSFEL